ncbi:ROK family protein [Adhaeribacter radiodurans]|uniref:ROK family protein n=1 Tax=Adhaeribacter radiodurans TaxID=2745197 RepID=A0A7L7L6Z7_9BACT|nr:ROK family protein [Adhaeribacter radiodurans]QMU28553.1 ROK family protein [Adhaeribacter radiodurans]
MDMLSEHKIIGLDIGGTKIHIGLVEAGKITKELKIATAAQASKKEILNQLVQSIEQLMEPDVMGIGVGVPGLVDEEKGVVCDVQNIPDFTEIPLKNYLEDYFRKSVYLTNDANSFILGEKLYGRAQPYKNVVGLTLGTGFGGGIILNNQLYSGAFSSAGEFGGIPYLDSTLEDYCSGKFFQNQFGVLGQEVHQAAVKGDNRAIAMLEQFGTHLGEAIKMILFALAPEAIFLGGSVSKCFPFFKDAMQQRVEEFPFERVKKQLIIEQSHMRNGAILGAAALVQMKSKVLSPL